jgi:hypothetical protein
MPRHTSSSRLSIAARIVLAVVGGYILTYQTTAALAVLLPLEPAEATLAATMLSFSVYGGIVLLVFAVPGLWRTCACTIMAIGIARLVSWLFAA